MLKKILVSAVTISLMALTPAWAGPGSDSTNDITPKQSQVQNIEETQNMRQYSQLKIQNKINLNAQYKEVNNQVCGLLERVQLCLRTMQQTRTITKEDCERLNCDLVQLKKQYKQQTSAEEREQIRNLFTAAYRFAREQNNSEEAITLLRDIISIDPKNAENYKELGSMLCTRGKNKIRVFCNGCELQPDDQPIIRKGRTLVPVRAITEGLGAQVQWNEAKQTVNINKGETCIQLQVKNKIALVNGNQVNLNVPAEMINSRVLVPLRFISEALKAEVSYYPECQIITVNQ